MTDITDNIQNYIDNFSKNGIAEGEKYIKFQNDRIFTSSIIVGNKIKAEVFEKEFKIYEKYSDQNLNEFLKQQDIPNEIINQANREQKINVLQTLAKIDTENLNNMNYFNLRQSGKNEISPLLPRDLSILYVPLEKKEGELLAASCVGSVERYNPTELLKTEIEAKKAKDLSINNLDNGKNYNQLLENIKQENITEDKENSISNVHTLGKSISVLM